MSLWKAREESRGGLEDDAIGTLGNKKKLDSCSENLVNAGIKDEVEAMSVA